MKGQSLPISTIGKVVLVLVVVGVVFAAFSGSFNDLLSGFVDSVEFPSPSP